MSYLLCIRDIKKQSLLGLAIQLLMADGGLAGCQLNFKEDVTPEMRLMPLRNPKYWWEASDFVSRLPHSMSSHLQAHLFSSVSLSRRTQR